MTITRLLVENHGPDSKAAKTALEQADKHCQSGKLNHITLVYPQKQSFRDSLIAEIFGRDASTALYDGQSIQLTQEITLDVIFFTQIPMSVSPNTLILATWLDIKEMDKIDGLFDVTNILYLPNSKDDGIKWLETWKPQVVPTASWSPSGETLSPEIETAIDDIKNVINMSSNLTHASDEKYVKDTFKDLRKRGGTATTAMIRQYALQNGWKPAQGRHFAEVAARALGCA